MKDYEKAKENFNKALKIDRSDFKSYTYLGDIDFAEKEYKSARFKYMYSQRIVGKGTQVIQNFTN